MQESHESSPVYFVCIKIRASLLSDSVRGHDNNPTSTKPFQSWAQEQRSGIRIDLLQTIDLSHLDL